MPTTARLPVQTRAPSAVPGTASARALRPRTIGLAWIALVLATFAASPFVGLERSVALLAAASYATLPLLRRWPTLALLGVATLCTLEPLTTSLLLTGGLLRWNTFNYVLLAIALVNLLPLVRASGWHELAALAFVGLLVLQLPLGADPREGMQTVLAVLALFGLLAILLRATDGAAWLWMGIAAGVVGAAGTASFTRVAESLPPINANAWSYMPLTALFALCLALPFARGWGAILGVVALSLANLAAVVGSASRGSMLLGAAIVCFLLVAPGRGRWRLAAAACVLTLTALLALRVPAAERRAIARVALLFDREASAVDRTSGRAALVAGGLVLFHRAPLGIGTGGFAIAWSGLGPRDGLPTWGRNQMRLAHAGWLKVLVENGVPGVLLFATFVALFVVRGVGSVAWERRCVGVLTGSVLALAFLTTEFQSKGPWFLAAGAMRLLATVAPGAPARRRR